jgi:hypothetical protein
VLLPEGGLDVFYVDESTDQDFLVMSAITVPFLRQVEGEWLIRWEEYFDKALAWRRVLQDEFEIPLAKDLNGSKLAAGRGRYFQGKHQLGSRVGCRVMVQALGGTSFLPDASIISVVGTRESKLYGHTRLEAVLYALLQRMRTACEKAKRLGMVFFDEGHGEYRTLYHKARKALPTGSDRGVWAGGSRSRDLPLANFVKDANIKKSQHSQFIQIADLVAYACLARSRSEVGRLTSWQEANVLGSLYDSIPERVLNRKASRWDPQGIVRL